MDRRLVGSLAGALIAFAGAGQAAAKAPSRASAKADLVHAQHVANGRGAPTGRELSVALHELALSLPALSGDDRGQAEALLARPDDNNPDPSGTHKWDATARATAKVADLPHFRIHYVTSPTSNDRPSQTDTSPANGTPDYVDSMGTVLEEVYACENGSGATDCAAGSAADLGWTPPADDSPRGGDARLDVYISDLYPDQIFGYTATDPGQGTDPSTPHTSYMVLDKDYSRFEGAAAADAVERVTVAHEYNHVLQNVYDFAEDTWMFEATAVWAEEKVYPQINDYLNYVKAWARDIKVPLTTFNDQTLKPYGSAVWNHFLESRYGAGVVRAAWELSPGAGDFAPGAYAGAIVGSGGAGFGDEFAQFSAAVAEWQVPGSGFPDQYPDLQREAILPVGNSVAGVSLPHTTFAFFDVPVPQGAPVIRLTAVLPDGVSGAVALVGRAGPDLVTGPVTRNVALVPSGGPGFVELADPGAYRRITAVVVNTDVTRSGFDQTTGDWTFSHDATGVAAAMEAPAPPGATTGPASDLRDHGATVTGSVDPNLLDTTWRFEYGATTAYGQKSPPQTAPASTVTTAPVGAVLTGLKANTTYHYRVIAANAAGSTAGPDLTFRTARDVTPPELEVTVAKKQRIRRVRARGVAYKARCGEACKGTAQLEITKAAARRLGLPRVLGKARVSLKARSRASTLHVRLGARARKGLAAVKRVKVTLRVVVADSSKNRRSAKRAAALAR